MKTLIESLKNSLNEEKLNPITINFVKELGKQISMKFTKILNNKDVKDLFKKCKVKISPDNAEFSNICVSLFKTDKNLFILNDYDINDFHDFIQESDAFKQYINNIQKLNKTFGNVRFNKCIVNAFDGGSNRLSEIVGADIIFGFSPDSYFESIPDEYKNSETVDKMSTIIIDFIEDICSEFKDTFKTL